MVGQLIRLKLRIIWNTVRKQTVVLVLAVLGVLYFGGIYTSALVGTAFLARSDEASLATPVMAIAGPFIFLLWLVLPIIFASMDNSLDPVRLSPYVGPSKRLGAGLAASTAVGPGGLLSAMILFLPVWFALWRAQWLEALGWFIAGLVTLPLAVLWARAQTMAGAPYEGQMCRQAMSYLDGELQKAVEEMKRDKVVANGLPEWIYNYLYAAHLLRRKATPSVQYVL